MLYLVICAVILVLSLALRLASALGLTIPLLYALLAPTLFYDWFHANPVLAEGIGYALFALTVFSWVIALIRKLTELIQRKRDDRIAGELFLRRLRQAKAEGRDTVSTEGLWR